jgi:hypothetical protein
LPAFRHFPGTALRIPKSVKKVSGAYETLLPEYNAGSEVWSRNYSSAIQFGHCGCGVKLFILSADIAEMVAAITESEPDVASERASYNILG